MRRCNNGWRCQRHTNNTEYLQRWKKRKKTKIFKERVKMYGKLHNNLLNGWNWLDVFLKLKIITSENMFVATQFGLLFDRFLLLQLSSPSLQWFYVRARKKKWKLTSFLISFWIIYSSHCQWCNRWRWTRNICFTTIFGDSFQSHPHFTYILINTTCDDDFKKRTHTSRQNKIWSSIYYYIFVSNNFDDNQIKAIFSSFLSFRFQFFCHLLQNEVT